MSLTATSIDTEYEALIPKEKPNKQCRNLVTIICLFIGCLLIAFQLLSSKPRSNTMIHQDNEEIDKVLFTNNPYTDYLCEPEFLFKDVNIYPNKYQFTCAMISSFGTEISTQLSCNTGYSLKCIVSASYGRTAGNCDEPTENELGCGFAYNEAPVICEENTISCGDSSGSTELESCINLKTGSKMSTRSPCSDCMPICVCGMDKPQFYNVADCFGDTTSTICSGKDGDNDPQNIYLPLSVWKNDCKGKNQCTLQLSNTGKTYSCWNEEFKFKNVYYNSINGETFDDFQDVIIDEMYTTCAYMDLKVLAVCELS